MSTPEPSPREMARAFTPKLSALVDDPLFSDVWADPTLSPRDRSIATVAALIALYRPEQLPVHLRRARENGVTRRRASRAHHAYCVLCRLPCGNLRLGDCGADADGLTENRLAILLVIVRWDFTKSTAFDSEGERTRTALPKNENPVWLSPGGVH